MNKLALVRFRLKYGSRIVEAAQQMWAYVQKGVSFEIPAALSTDDATTKALLCLQDMHPGCPVSMLQSRGIVVGHVKTAQGVSPEAWNILDRGGYFPDSKKAANAQEFLAQQEQFMRRSLTGLAGGREDYEVDALVAKAQAEQTARDAIVLETRDAVAEVEKPLVEAGSSSSTPTP